jgi:peptidoglycan hydrolase-like protein with peptidoglycan-binding domain
MIEHSVGRGGFNDRNDVLLIQNALTVCRLQGGKCAIALDGLVGPETIGAITDYQQRNGLIADGRVDVRGPTEVQLRSDLGEEAAVFSYILTQLFQAYEPIPSYALIATAKTQPLFSELAMSFKPLFQYSDLTSDLKKQPALVQASLKARPPVFGFFGVDDAAEAIGLVLLAAAVAAIIIIMTQSPAFQKAVQERAKELDRILGELSHNIQQKVFEKAVNLIIAITSESVNQAAQCRKAPTFNPTPECLEAIQQFNFIVQRIKKQVDELRQLIVLFLTGQARGLPVHTLKTQIQGLLSRAQQNAFDLQVALQEMRDKCNCPDV